MDAVLNERQFNIFNVERGLLLNFPAQRGHGRFAEFDLPAWYSPQVGPFRCADHQDLSSGVEDERSDSRNRLSVFVLKLAGRRSPDLELIDIQQLAQLTEMFDDQI